MSRICSRVSSSDAREGEGEGEERDTTLGEGEGKFVNEKGDSSCSGEFGCQEVLCRAEGLSERGTCRVNNVM